MRERLFGAGIQWASCPPQENYCRLNTDLSVVFFSTLPFYQQFESLYKQDPTTCPWRNYTGTLIPKPLKWIRSHFIVTEPRQDIHLPFLAVCSLSTQTRKGGKKNSLSLSKSQNEEEKCLQAEIKNIPLSDAKMKRAAKSMQCINGNIGGSF